MKRNECEVKYKKEDLYTEEYYSRILNKERYIILYGDIENCSADLTVTKIKGMNYLNSKPITLEINSVGGSVSDGIAIINAIEQSKAPVTTIVTGEACSMGALISVAGKRRLIYYNSFWMEHPIEDGMVQSVSTIKDRAAYLDRLEKATQQILRKYTKLTEEEIKKAAHGELWLSAEEALAKGVVDEIIK